MRIEIDQDLAAALDTIKREQPLIYGRGHVETVRFLVNYYQQHGPLKSLLDDFTKGFETFLDLLDTRIDVGMERAILKAMRHAIANLFEIRDEKGTVERADVDQDPSREGR